MKSYFIAQKNWISYIYFVYSIYFNRNYDDWNLNLDIVRITTTMFLTIEDFSSAKTDYSVLILNLFTNFVGNSMIMFCISCVIDHNEF